MRGKASRMRIGCSFVSDRWIAGGPRRLQRRTTPARRRRAAAAAPDAAKEPAPPPSVTVIGARDAHGILGRDVRSAANEDMGRIVDVIVDREGTVRAAVIDFGGFLGVGSRKIVVDWSALRFGGVSNKSDSITLELTKEQVDGGARIQGGHAGHRARRGRQSAAVGIRPLSGEQSGRASFPFDRSDRRRSPRAIRRGGNVVPLVPRAVAARRAGQRRRAKASAASTGSSSFWPTCRPASGRSLRSI